MTVSHTEVQCLGLAGVLRIIPVGAWGPCSAEAGNRPLLQHIEFSPWTRENTVIECLFFFLKEFDFQNYHLNYILKHPTNEPKNKERNVL